MKKYTVLNHGEESHFIGKLLAQTDTKKEDNQPTWTEFEIYLRDDMTYVVNVLRRYISGESNGRSFFCEDLYKVQQCLGHPVYNSVSFRAQMCYNFARKALIADGVIQPYEYPLTLDDEDRPAMLTPEQRNELNDIYTDFDDDDFDFTE
jgi:hypothetical protein